MRVNSKPVHILAIHQLELKKGKPSELAIAVEGFNNIV
jgi:hypothetical protein